MVSYTFQAGRRPINPRVPGSDNYERKRLDPFGKNLRSRFNRQAAPRLCFFHMYTLQQPRLSFLQLRGSQLLAQLSQLSSSVCRWCTQIGHPFRGEHRREILHILQHYTKEFGASTTKLQNVSQSRNKLLHRWGKATTCLGTLKRRSTLPETYLDGFSNTFRRNTTVLLLLQYVLSTQQSQIVHESQVLVCHKEQPLYHNPQLSRRQEVLIRSISSVSPFAY